MRFEYFQIVLLFLSLVMMRAASGADTFGVDVVTMKNGDIHHGTVAHEFFSIETPFGRVSVPYGMMAELHPGHDRGTGWLLTRQGDTFTGRIVEKEFTILRIVETTLPVSVADITDISFVQRPMRKRQRSAGDAVATRDGDRFFAHLVIDEVSIEDGASVHTIVRDRVQRLDFASRYDGEEFISQVSSLQGEIFQGTIGAGSLTVQTEYGQTLAIPVVHLSTVVFDADQYNDRPDFYNARLKSATVLRDRMVDGFFAPEIVVLEGGNYLRGDAQGDDDEKPPTPVMVAPFGIGITEVTFEQYDRFCEDTRRERPDDSDWGRGQRPAINVSWQDAVAYTEWLSRKTRQAYRLPTDAEWEYAMRAGNASRFWWGDEPGIARANCEGCGSLWDGDKTAPVGSFAPNPFGLYDTAGNVFEWVADCYNNSYADAPADGSAFDKPGCGKRVIRGGAWSFPSQEIRSANRWRDFPTRHSDDTGFRIVREL